MSEPTIVIVDDNREILQGLTRYLSSRGLHVVASDSPFGVSALVLRHAPAAVVLDVTMPGLDGRGIATLLRGNPTTRDTRIIFYSALPEEELYALARSVPGSSYVTKSDGIHALESALVVATAP
jgi:CheY-like chemotaxis protein